MPLKCPIGECVIFVVCCATTLYLLAAILNSQTVEKIPCQIVDAQKSIDKEQMVDVYVTLGGDNSTSSVIRVYFDCWCSGTGNLRTCENKCLKDELNYYRDQIDQDNLCDKHDRTISRILMAPYLFLSEKPYEFPLPQFVFALLIHILLSAAAIIKLISNSLDFE